MKIYMYYQPILETVYNNILVCFLFLNVLICLKFLEAGLR